VILCTALAVCVTSHGPIFFRQRRIGRDGKAFDLYKFRSMYLDPTQAKLGDDDASALESLLGGDTAPGGVEGKDRRTPVGRLLRRSSLDELPQLLNVLRGEMSLIGPRPERPEFVELFNEDIIRYGDRHRVKSGITGWAQVHGLRGQTSLAERVEWDNYYIAHWSLGLDLKILALTLLALFRDAE
jgi:lipopolysaccharide/colanic/teichoic acid biosynthesis glycosyltransferase